MRMRDAVVRRGRMRVAGDHAVAVELAVDQIAPVEANLEWPEIDAFEFDRVGGHGDRAASAVAADFLEFPVEFRQVRQQIA